MTRPLLYTLGIISLILGIIGAVLPIVPTTPFAILAAYLFSKSSPRMHHWILNLKYLGPRIKEWEVHKVISPMSKFASIVTIFAMISSTFFFVRTYMWAKVCMVLVAVGVSAFIWAQKSHPDIEDEESSTTNINSHSI
jgi:uncharacterized protein